MHSMIAPLYIAQTACKAIVVLQVVNLPFLVHGRVLVFKTETAGTTLTRHDARVRVEAEFQAEIVHVCTEGSNAVGKFGMVFDNVARNVAVLLPAVVQIQVFVAQILEAQINEGMGRVVNERLLQVFAMKLIPTVPAHGRSQADAIVVCHCS